jgi:flagellar M-ring protein FliF
MATTGMGLMRGRVMQEAARLTTGQKLALGAAFLATAGGLLLLSRLNSTTEMAVLYADLDAGAAAAVVDGLEARGVRYELSEGGRTVKVPKHELYETRLALSAEGLPDMGGGWSVLDNQGITTSEFDQRVGFQRAMEGELARTIAVIEGVERANVHLVIPRSDLFVRDDAKSSASVLVQLEPGASLTAGQVQSIVNLVSSSIEGLTPGSVTVTDNLGRTLAAPGGGSSSVMEGEQREARTRAYEQAIAAQLESMLAAVVGPGNAMVAVKADLDFDTVVTTREEYRDPERADGERTVVGETTRVEEYTGAPPGIAGVLGAEEEVTGGEAATGQGTTYNLDERDVSYAVDKTVTSTERAPGAVRSLSVAVLLNQDGPAAGQEDQVQALVQAATGIDLERGDKVEVTLLPFDTSYAEAIQADLEAAADAQSRSALIGLVRTVGTVLLALVVLVIGILMVRKGRQRTVVQSLDLQQFAEYTQPLPLEAAPVEEAEPARPRKKVQVATDPTVEDLSSLIKNQPDEVAALLRTWMGPTGAAR